MGKRVGLLGGTFDPVHNGHISIADSFLESEFIDELWIILTPHPPHKDRKSITDFETRMEMLDLAFSGKKNIRVMGIEKELPKPSYTIRTILHLEETNPEVQFYLCIGEDSLADFKQWHRYMEILEHCDLLVAKRPDTQYGKDDIDPDIYKHIYFVEHKPVDISSTELRNKIRIGDKIDRLVPLPVRKFIQSHQLYRT